MAGYLKRELAVASFVKQLAGCWLLDRQSAKHERTGRKTKSLVRLLTLQTDAGYDLRTPKFLL